MHCHADHLHLRLELQLTTWTAFLLEALHSYQRAVCKTALVDFTKATSSKYVLVVEVVGSNLQFP